jgi:hypothetical protein
MTLDIDTDNGGATDGSEDGNKNGRVDAGERNPLVSSDDLIILPLIITNFTVKKCNENVCLFWQTQNEINTNFIEIQKIEDGNSFIRVEDIFTKKQLLNQYYYEDVLKDIVVSSKIFYSLKQVDLYGQTKYSKILLITNSKDDLILVYPNPLNNQFSIHTNQKLTKV